MPKRPRKAAKKKRPADKPPKKGATKPPAPRPKPPPPIVSESYNRAVRLNTPRMRDRLSGGDLINAIVQTTILFNVLGSPESTKAYAQQHLIEQYLALEVPAGRTVELVWEENRYDTDLDGSPATARVPVRGSFSVGRPGDPPGWRNPNAIVVRKTIVGTGPATELPDDEYMTDAVLLSEDAEYAARLLAERSRPQMSRPGGPPVSGHLLEVFNEAIDEYLDKTKRTEGGGGGGGGGDDDDDAADPSAALPPEDVEHVKKKRPQPEIVDLPLPESGGVAVASVGGGRTSTAKAASKAASKAKAASAETDGGGIAAFAHAAPPPPSQKATDALARWRAATWQGHQHVLDLIAYGRPAPPPTPPYPGSVKAPSQHLTFDGLRKLHGKPVKDGSPLWNVHRVLVAELGEKGPIHAVREDADGDHTWIEMQLAGRYRAPSENAQAGDIVIVADAAAVDGGYPAIVLDSNERGPKELLVARESGVEFHAVEMPPTATVLDAWVPRPSHTLSDDSPIGQFWGPGMKRMRGLLEAYVDTNMTEDEFVAAIAAGIRREASTVGELHALVDDETYIAGPGTPMYPGAVVFGRDEEVGVVMSDGSVLGISEVAEYDNLPYVMRMIRFVPSLVWYPSPR